MFSSYDGTSSGDYQSRIDLTILETLKFTNMDSWEHWDESEATDFPCLRHLTFLNCTGIRRLPKLLALVNLQIKNCECLLDLPSFPSLQFIKMEGFCSVNHLLQLPMFSHRDISTPVSTRISYR
ncbi:hypothetical protein ABZP36_003454 [Zizania latifolia]